MIADEISKRRSRTLPIGHATGTRQRRGIMTTSELRPETNALAARSLLERVTGIEPALSAWKAVPSGPVTWLDLRGGLSASDRERPFFTGVNGTLMARRPLLEEKMDVLLNANERRKPICRGARPACGVMLPQAQTTGRPV